jgi:hypothetical protein
LLITGKWFAVKLKYCEAKILVIFKGFCGRRGTGLAKKKGIE